MNTQVRYKYRKKGASVWHSGVKVFSQSRFPERVLIQQELDRLLKGCEIIITDLITH